MYNVWNNTTRDQQKYKKPKTGNAITKIKRTKGQTTICRALHKKQKIEQHELHQMGFSTYRQILNHEWLIQQR